MTDTPEPPIYSGYIEEAEPPATQAWTFDPESRDIEFNGAPIFRVYSSDDFPCVEDDDREADDAFYDAQAQTVVLMLNSLLHNSAEPDDHLVREHALAALKVQP